MFQYGTGNQVINGLLTGYKIHVSRDLLSMSCSKNVELLNDVTCHTT